MNVEIPHRCLACYGSGFCALCKGNGRYLARSTNALRDCNDCAGSGVCPECDGTGRVPPEAEDD